MSCMEERSGWSRIASLFSSIGTMRSTGKKAGYARLRSGHTRLEELQLKEVNTQSIHCYIKIELAKYAAQHGIWRLLTT